MLSKLQINVLTSAVAAVAAAGLVACSSDDTNPSGAKDASADVTSPASDGGAKDSSVDAAHDAAPDGEVPDSQAHDGGADASLVVDYTFDTSVEGWTLNTYDDPNELNLGAPSDAAVQPTLTENTTDGHPTPGSIQVVAPFTGPNQYVDAITSSPPPNMSGLMIHAYARLVCGSFTSGGAKLHVSTGSNYAYIGGTFVSASSFTPGTWVPLTLDLASVTPVDGGADPTMVVQLGVQFITLPPTNTGDAGDAGDAGQLDAGDAAVDAEVDAAADAEVDAAADAEADAAADAEADAASDAGAHDGGDAGASDAGDAGSPCAHGETVFEIDTVTN
jgi:hypothetical protein